MFVADKEHLFQWAISLSDNLSQVLSSLDYKLNQEFVNVVDAFKPSIKDYKELVIH